jgi:hypothetical protein
MAAVIPAPPAPTEFDARLANWIVDTCKESVFFIRIVPRIDVLNVATRITSRMRAVRTKNALEQQLTWNHDLVSSGFVVAVMGNQVLILTCAHILDHVFKGSMPISVAAANSLFQCRSLCHHYEHAHRHTNIIPVPARVYSEATIVDISCRHDLMLVRVRQDQLTGFDGQVCQQRHTPLRLAEDIPIGISRCVMISWPALMHCMVAEGHGSDNLRRISDISETNVNEYTMMLLEVNITSVAGSSGSPLLNGAGRVLALMQGGFGGGNSYFIPLQYVRPFLARNGI